MFFSRKKRLVLTGEYDRKHLLVVDGCEQWITTKCWRGIIQLVRALIESPSRGVELSYALARSIRKCVGKELLNGHQLYSLALRLEEIEFRDDFLPLIRSQLDIDSIQVLQKQFEKHPTLHRFLESFARADVLIGITTSAIAALVYLMQLLK